MLRIRRLDDEGKLEICGVFKGYPGMAGMYILKTDSREEAEELCNKEPLVTGGYATCKLVSLQIANRENNYYLYENYWKSIEKVCGNCAKCAEFQEKYIEKLEVGTLEVTFRYQLSDWTFLYLLSFGKYVEIIEPARAREILREKAKKILSMY